MFSPQRKPFTVAPPNTACETACETLLSIYGIICIVLVTLASVGLFMYFVYAGGSSIFAGGSSIFRYFECPISLSGEVCNGGKCYNTGYCGCSSPMFSGAACDVTLCPGFDARKNTVCGGHGVCGGAEGGVSGAAWARAAPRECAAKTSGGWDSSSCLVYINEKTCKLDGTLVVPQFALDGSLVMMPTCTCSDGWTGRACDVPDISVLQKYFNAVEADTIKRHGSSIEELLQRCFREVVLHN